MYCGVAVGAATCMFFLCVFLSSQKLEALRADIRILEEVWGMPRCSLFVLTKFALRLIRQLSTGQSRAFHGVLDAFG